MYDEKNWKLEGHTLAFVGPWERASWLYPTMRQAGIRAGWAPGGLVVHAPDVEAAIAFDKAAGPTPKPRELTPAERKRRDDFYAQGANVGYREDFHSDG